MKAKRCNKRLIVYEILNVIGNPFIAFFWNCVSCYDADDHYRLIEKSRFPPPCFRSQIRLCLSQ